MEKQVLTKEDIITIVKYLIELINSKAEIDDIDHLSNRRVELLENNCLNNLVLVWLVWLEPFVKNER
jgi:DNA-directed RNA polymerase beta subunit